MRKAVWNPANAFLETASERHQDRMDNPEKHGKINARSAGFHWPQAWVSSLGGGMPPLFTQKAWGHHAGRWARGHGWGFLELESTGVP